MKTLHVYTDASWKDGIATFSFYNTHECIFYVSVKFQIETSMMAECYSAYYGLLSSLKFATNNDYTHLILHTDLQNLVGSFNFKPITTKAVKPITESIMMLIAIFSDELEISIEYTKPKTQPIMRLVDMLAYRKINNMNLESNKSQVFGEFKNVPVVRFLPDILEYTRLWED